MKHNFKLPCMILATALAAALQLAATAAVPVAWTNSPGMPPYPIKPVPHGSTVDLAVTLKGYTTPPIADGADVRLWYQTNGMGSAWWSAPATFDGSTITASFGPAQDCGADRVSLFFGAPSNVFASAVLRLTHAPGFTPSVLTLPVQRLDFAAVETANAPYYTKSETESKIAELSPPTSLAPATNYTDSATNALDTALRNTIEDKRGSSDFSANVWSLMKPDGSILLLAIDKSLPMYWHTSDEKTRLVFESPDLWTLRDEVDGIDAESTAPHDAASLDFVDIEHPLQTYSLTRSSRIALDIDIPSPPDLTPYATKSALQSVSNIAEDVRTESALVYRLYSGSNVVAEVTNYNSAVHAPSLRLMQLNESNEYVTVWTETNGLARTFRDATNYTDGAIAAYAAPRAWSRTTSGLGSDAPANTTWISTPRTVIAGGLEYAKIVDTYGEVWVLTSNGMAAEFNPDTNAYFRITADDGTPVFSIEKSDAQVVGAYAEGITASANSVTIPVPVVSAEAPTMYWRNQLDSGDWSDQTTPPTGATVTWSGTAGSWVCTVTFSGTRPPLMFFKFSFIQEGGVVIRNNATTDLSSGIWVNGTKFVPTVSGNNLIWTKQ